jgi:hypothetical protein
MITKERRRKKLNIARSAPSEKEEIGKIDIFAADEIERVFKNTNQNGVNKSFVVV